VSVKVTKSNVEKYTIIPEGRDKIEVILDEPTEGFKTITMSSWDNVFKFGWGACGPCLREFMIGCGDDYLASKLLKKSDCINVRETVGKIIGRIPEHDLSVDEDTFIENLRGIDDDIDNANYLWGEIIEANNCFSSRHVDLDEYIEFEEFFMDDFIEMEPTGEYRHLFGYIWPHVKAVFEKELKEEYQESMGMADEDV